MNFTIKDSGERIDYPSGMRRDVDKTKPRYDLIDREFLKRWAEHMRKGAEKYGEENWRKANSEPELKRFMGSAMRHLIQWMNGEEDEDHAAAVAFNIAAAEMVKTKLVQKPEPKRRKCICKYCGKENCRWALQEPRYWMWVEE